jgi:hypothetical protein
MESAKLYPACAFAAGLVITLFLAAYLTPRSWWRRPNARALLIMVTGAWAFGSLILYAVHGSAQAGGIAATSATATGAASTKPDAIAEARALSAAAAAREAAATAGAKTAGPIAGRPFVVHRDLNLRAAAGVHAARLVTVPAGATVTPSGIRSGDWWQIKARVDGRESTGWVSSLWLRRSGE